MSTTPNPHGKRSPTLRLQISVARFFVYALLGEDSDVSFYSQSGQRIAELAVTGIRLVIEEFRSDVTKGSRLNC
jgi:hypothetical protein